MGFCTGNDQSYDPELEHGDYRGHRSETEVRYNEVVMQMPQPVIAAVDGFAIGSGNILAYTCDFTIATTRSKFGQTGPRVGSPANGHNVAMLAARIGQKRAREMWMLCRHYPADQAEQMGLVNTVVPLAEIWDEVERWCEELLSKSPGCLEILKASFDQEMDGYNEMGVISSQYYPDWFDMPEGKEGGSAFQEKRTPRFWSLRKRDAEAREQLREAYEKDAGPESE